jgi:hypothetical protein
MNPLSFPPSGFTPEQSDLVRAVLRGERIGWTLDAAESVQADFLRLARRHHLLPLLHQSLQNSGAAGAWPAQLQTEMRNEARRQALFDGMQSAEIAAVASEAERRGVRTLFLKGTPLAHTLYPFSHLRPRVDADVFVARKDFTNFAEILTERGYERRNALSGSQINRQADFVKRPISLDVHWKISNSPLFDALFDEDEAMARRCAVPSLGPQVFTLAELDAALLACAHLALNLTEEFRLIWVYDIHLFGERLSDLDLDELFRRATEKGVRRIVHFSMTLARSWFDTRLPDAFARHDANAAAPERTALLLTPHLTAGRRYAIEFGHLSLRDRLAFLREIALPSSDYLLKRYGKRRRGWLPLLYLHRGLRGLLRRMTA